MKITWRCRFTILFILLGLGVFLDLHIRGRNINKADQGRNINRADETHTYGPLCQEKDVQYVILFGYERSGSTFTGEIFNQNKEIFYMYEPLHYGHATKQFPFIRELNVTRHNKETAVKDLENYLSCQISKVPTKHFEDHSKLNRVTSSSFVKCLKEDTSKLNMSMKTSICCMKYKIRAVKLVRSSMEEIQQLLSQNSACAESIHLIHLLRDPRGQVSSLGVTNKAINIKTDETVFEKLCSRTLKDIQIRKNIDTLYPGKVLELSYEDMARDATLKTKYIYKYLFDQNPNNDIMKWVKSSSGNKKNGSAFSTKRINSTKTSLKWKKQLNKDILRKVEKHCKKLIKYLGFDLLLK